MVLPKDDNAADLVVVGGGPAGSVSALLAARKGARVVLIDPDRTPARLEGLGERLLGWLRSRGLEGCLPSDSPFVPRLALWAGQESAHNGEVLVERAAFDHRLRAAAAEAGARLVCGTATVAPAAAGVTATLSDGRRITAPRAIDARGRKAHGGRRVQRGPASLAIGGWFAAEPDAPPEARVAPIPEGWLWLARPGDGRQWIQVTLDAREGEADPGGRLRAALEAAEAVGAMPAPGDRRPLPEALLVRECAPVLPADPIDLRFIPAGDAAGGMDPLSGQGMFWAVSGALAAHAALETLESRPGADSEDLARRYLQGRIRETYLRQARLGRDFLRQETRFAGQPFWERRRVFPDDVPLHDAANGTLPRVERSIVVENGLLAEREVVITRQTPSGVAWVAGLPAAELFRAMSEGAGEEALARRWDPEAVRCALAWFQADPNGS